VTRRESPEARQVAILTAEYDAITDRYFDALPLPSVAEAKRQYCANHRDASMPHATARAVKLELKLDVPALDGKLRQAPDGTTVMTSAAK
jgi:hypothetical protein